MSASRFSSKLKSFFVSAVVRRARSPYSLRVSNKDFGLAKPKFILAYLVVLKNLRSSAFSIPLPAGPGLRACHLVSVLFPIKTEEDGDNKFV
jgi:hypothetical protein